MKSKNNSNISGIHSRNKEERNFLKVAVIICYRLHEKIGKIIVKSWI